MKNNSYLLLAAAFLVFTGCGPEKKTNVTTPAPANGAFNNQAPANTGDPIQRATPPTESGTLATAVAMNPAHGMPSHRCDIPVGAPLNSPAQTNTTVAPKLPAPTLPMPAQGSLAAGTNPAHGQPGHDCAIPVGAPLKKL
ncbi:MAG: hypothetical protein JWQ14_2749 [Adhaeribacter sp.]|nr:hypothetical protein [Adhaeribacter sp.]